MEFKQAEDLSVRGVLGNNGAISKMFDGYSERPSQVQLAEIINECYSSNKNLLAEAPTGIGKSLAALIPAILNNKFKTVIATATKSLQEQYYRKDLPFLQEVFGDRFSYCMLKGRSNYVCLNRFNEFGTKLLVGEIDKSLSYQFQLIKDWLPNSLMGDMEELDFNIAPEIKANICSDSDECLGKKCLYKTECPFKKNRTKAENSTIVLVNIDLLSTDLVIKNMHNASVLPKFDVLIIDEAHELEGIISKYLGFKISNNAVKTLVMSIIKYIGKTEKIVGSDEALRVRFETDKNTIDGLCTSLKKNSLKFFGEFIYEEVDGKDTFRITANDISDVVRLYGKQILSTLVRIKSSLSSFDRYSYDEEYIELNEKLLKRIDSVSDRIGKVMEIFDAGSDPDYVYWVTYSNKGEPIIECAPIDISGYMKDWLFTRRKESFGTECIRSVIMMSATLTTNKNFDFIQERLGVEDFYPNTFDKQTLRVILDSAFDYGHNALLYIPKGMVDPSGQFGKKESYTLQLSQHIKNLANITKGKMLCLFTSYLEMNKVYEMLNGQLPYPMFNQSMYPKKELISMFKENKESILFATSSFWTGVSFEGETCSAVVIDKIPFPVPSDPIIEARIDRIKRRGGDWFNGYYLPMAILEMQQGFGRLIRTKTDMGVVMICDNRIVTKPYGSRFLRSFPPTLRTNKIEKVELFFNIVEKKREILRKRGEIK